MQNQEEPVSNSSQDLITNQQQIQNMECTRENIEAEDETLSPYHLFILIQNHIKLHKKEYLVLIPYKDEYICRKRRHKTEYVLKLMDENGQPILKDDVEEYISQGKQINLCNINNENIATFTYNKENKILDFIDTKKEKIIKEYQRLSTISPENPIEDNLILSIGDTHGDMYSMLEPLLINGIIKLTPSEDEDCSYKIEEGPYKEKFRRVVFLGDYVDRGDFSVENIKNIVKLDKLFNSQNNTKSETDNNGDFMKFLCGNHDTLYFFYNMDGYSDSKQQSYELRELLFSEKEEDKKLIQDFYSALSVAHMEELDCKKELYYTHSYCTKKCKKPLKSKKVNI